MTMEFVNGWNLEEFLDRHVETEQYIALTLLFLLFREFAEVLAMLTVKETHREGSLGIVHRDVNPKNIMIAKEGDVMLTDFGIAKALDLMYNKEGEVIAGKDEYLSPEQARCEITDHRADLFCCGIVMSEFYWDTIFSKQRSQKRPSETFWKCNCLILAILDQI